MKLRLLLPSWILTARCDLKIIDIPNAFLEDKKVSDLSFSQKLTTQNQEHVTLKEPIVWSSRLPWSHGSPKSSTHSGLKPNVSPPLALRQPHHLFLFVAMSDSHGHHAEVNEVQPAARPMATNLKGKPSAESQLKLSQDPWNMMRHHATIGDLRQFVIHKFLYNSWKQWLKWAGLLGMGHSQLWLKQDAKWTNL